MKITAFIVNVIAVYTLIKVSGMSYEMPAYWLIPLAVLAIAIANYLAGRKCGK